MGWKGEGHTWGHVESGSAAKVRGVDVGCRQAKVRQLDGHPVVCYEYVLRLEVPVVDPNGMAILHSIQNLEESTLGQRVVAHEEAPLRDVGEQIALGAKLNDNKSTINRVHDANQGNHIGVLAGHVVELDLTLLELALPGVETRLVEGLDGIGDVGVDVDGGVDHAIRTHAQDAGELQAVGQEQA